MSGNPDEEDYRWSKTRIAEQVTINILSALGTAISLALLAALLSGLGLLAQWLFQYVVIPTNVLAALFFIGIGILIVLMVIAGVVALFYRWLGKHPGVALAIYLGFIGALLALSFEDKNTRTQFWEALRKAAGAKTQAAQQPSSSPQKEAAE